MPRPKRQPTLKPTKRKQSAALKKKRAETIKANYLKSRPVTLVLRTRHNVNGVIYGPGKVTVSRDLSAILGSSESQLIQNEERFYGTRSVIVGRRGPTGHPLIQMPDSTFKDPSWANNVEEESSVDKKGN